MVESPLRMRCSLMYESVSRSRIGFAGPSVILDTMYEKNQDAYVHFLSLSLSISIYLSILDNTLKQTKQNIRYDREAPRNFQRADYLQDRGQLDAVVQADEVENAVMVTLSVLSKRNESSSDDKKSVESKEEEEEKVVKRGDYTVSRALTRPQPQDILRGIFVRIGSSFEVMVESVMIVVFEVVSRR